MNAFHPLFSRQSSASKRIAPTPSSPTAKRFLCSALPSHRPIVSFDAQSPARNAPAEQTASYACILSDETFFYPEEREEGALFLLPKTYYVKVVERGEEYSLVEYGGGTPSFPSLTGYCKTEQLTFVDFIPARPYPLAEISLTYTLENSLPSSLSTITLTSSYYGDYAVGSTLYCYVFAEGSFGYVVRPNFTLEQNTDYLPSPNPDQPTETFPYAPLIIGSVVLLLLFASFLAALRSHPPRPRDWYEESP